MTLPDLRLLLAALVTRLKKPGTHSEPMGLLAAFISLYIWCAPLCRRYANVDLDWHGGVDTSDINNCFFFFVDMFRTPLTSSRIGSSLSSASCKYKSLVLNFLAVGIRLDR
jgi:hypothetical protein